MRTKIMINFEQILKIRTYEEFMAAFITVIFFILFFGD